MERIKRSVRKCIRDLSPYSTARDEYTGGIGIYLDANENPYDNGYNRYPDPYQKRLKSRLSEIKGVPAENIFVGNGSDEAIDLLYRIFCEPGVDNAVAIAPSYGMYRVAAAINDVEMREVPLGEGFVLDADALLAASDGRSKLLFLCSPNNPSGNDLAPAGIERLLREFPGMVVVDEAYIDFSCSESFVSRLGRYPNLVVLQTLSKAWGMAGLRLGLAFAGEYVTGLMTKVKYPYNINAATQRIVMKLLEEDVSGQVAEIISERKRIAQELARYRAVRKVWPSDANFLLVEVDDPAGIYTRLIEGGVIVRDRSRAAMCAGCLRITVGTPEENGRMLDIMRNIHVDTP